MGFQLGYFSIPIVLPAIMLMWDIGQYFRAMPNGIISLFSSWLVYELGVGCEPWEHCSFSCLLLQSSRCHAMPALDEITIPINLQLHL